MADTNFNLSQGLEILRPKADKALPVPCNEWDFLKEKIRTLIVEPWFFQSAGSIFIGAALGTLISVMTGTVSNHSEPYAIMIAWAIIIVCITAGAICLLFAHKERQVHRIRANDILMQMDLIEQRFERNP